METQKILEIVANSYVFHTMDANVSIIKHQPSNFIKSFYIFSINTDFQSLIKQNKNLPTQALKSGTPYIIRERTKTN